MRRLLCLFVGFLLNVSSSLDTKYYVLVQFYNGQTYVEYVNYSYLDVYVSEFLKEDKIMSLYISKYVYESDFD